MNSKKDNRMVPAVFLDKDGTITSRHGLTWQNSQVNIRPAAIPLIKFLNNHGVPVIVITNQAMVARGLISKKGVIAMHRFINQYLRKFGVKINAFYFCPHHPEATLEKYRKNCSCRKPQIGLFQQAAKDFSINLGKSFMIGDMTWDILAGNRLKMKTILLLQGYKGKDRKYIAKPDFKIKTLKSAIPIIKKFLFK